MALIKKTAFMAGISGKVQGSVFGQGKTGTYVRNQPKPVGGKTVDRIKSNSSLSFVSQQWKNLTIEEVTAWNNLAQNTILINRFGEEYSPSGYNLFCKRNISLLKTKKPLIRVPVASANFPDSNELQLFTYDQLRLNVKRSIILNTYSQKQLGTIQVSTPLDKSVNETGVYIGFRYLGLRGTINDAIEDDFILGFSYSIDDITYECGLFKGEDDKVLLSIDDSLIPIQNRVSVDVTDLLDYFDVEAPFSFDNLNNQTPLNKIRNFEKLVDKSTIGFILEPGEYPSLSLVVNHEVSVPVVSQEPNSQTNKQNTFGYIHLLANSSISLSAFISMNFCALSNIGELYQLQKGGYTLQDKGVIVYASPDSSKIIDSFYFPFGISGFAEVSGNFSFVKSAPVDILSQVRFLVGYDTKLEENVALQVFMSKPTIPGRVTPFSDCVYISECEDSYENDDDGPWVDCGDGYHTCPPNWISSFQGSVSNGVGYFGDGFSTTVWARFIDKGSGVTSRPVRLSEQSKKKVKFKAGSGLSGTVN